LFEYLYNPEIARAYDANLANTTLLEIDWQFAQEYFSRPGRLLDMGCGTGRLLIPFARKGFSVLGVDLSEAMLTVAARKGAEAGVKIGLLKANLVELDALADQSFDHAACLFSTLGMVSGRDQRMKVLRHAFRLLRPGGRLVLHVHNRWFDFWRRNTFTWLIRDCVKMLTGAEDAGDRPMPAHQGISGLALHHFARREISKILQAVGFRLLEIRPISLRPDGRVPLPFLFGRLRAYGYLIAAERPAA
jgi:ubiquinone/menaquinone biosynthesis C-methylase UbiE